MMPPLTDRSKSAVPYAAKLLLDGKAMDSTDAVLEVAPDLGPGERADVAYVAEEVARNAQNRVFAKWRLQRGDL